jgi:hypothetical protein
MKLHQWTDINARTKAELRRRIEAEAQQLSEDLRLSQLQEGARPDAGNDRRTPRS